MSLSNIKIYTIGHSTRKLTQLISILKKYKIKVLIDIRRYPKSRHNPQFNRETLEKILPKNKIKYIWLGDKLGGRLKRGLANSPNIALKSVSFRAYADYMLTAEFKETVQQIINIAKEKVTCYMCAESLPFRCHRYLLSDYLRFQGFEVIHIHNEQKIQFHTYTTSATIKTDNIVYDKINTF